MSINNLVGGSDDEHEMTNPESSITQSNTSTDTTYRDSAGDSDSDDGLAPLHILMQKRHKAQSTQQAGWQLITDQCEVIIISDDEDETTRRSRASRSPPPRSNRGVRKRQSAFRKKRTPSEKKNKHLEKEIDRDNTFWQGELLMSKESPYGSQGSSESNQLNAITVKEAELEGLQDELRKARESLEQAVIASNQQLGEAVRNAKLFEQEKTEIVLQLQEAHKNSELSQQEKTELVRQLDELRIEQDFIQREKTELARQLEEARIGQNLFQQEKASLQAQLEAASQVEKEELEREIRLLKGGVFCGRCLY